MKTDYPDIHFVSLPRRYALVAFIWSVLMAGALLWNLYQEKRDILDMATVAVRANIQKDIGFRKWAASHGGVYVSPTAHTPPNPYFNFPERDVVTTTGKVLTLMNPAYMLREIQADFPDDYGTRSRITSLKPLNPANAPDEWEIKALKSFEQGSKEFLEIQEMGSQSFMRMMKPFIVDEGCLKCHAHQGYKVGDVRGGIGSSVPLKQFFPYSDEHNRILLLSYGAIWLLGMAGLGIAYRHDSRLSAGKRRADIEIEHANRALATLSKVNKNLVHADSEQELLQSICQAIVEQHGYRMAWVGYKQDDEDSSIKVMSHAGHEQGYLDVVPLTWAETEYGMVPSGRAIRSGITQLCQDIGNDPPYQPWREAALGRGFLSSIALPLANSGVFGILTVYANEVDAFTPNEVALLEEMAGDLAFGVRALHVRKERDLALEESRQHFVKLQSNLEDTVRAIASMVEMRDPYTAGHQAKVAKLAAAIARQMGLPDEQVHGIHLAGVVHDLGKIRIPAEILSKPGKITEIEFDLIKIHPQAGYDILKGIDFPWPVAQMVLQHHERLDGSGYPQGLKDDAILLEARILAVADVVEAISAHRPYRAGLGVEAALEEIGKNRGVFYDPQVVDACVSIFREQGYVFPG